MCIKKKIAEVQEQIDAKLRLKTLLEKTQPLLNLISVICSDYREVAPEELPFLMDEIMQAAQVDLSVGSISTIAVTGDEKAQAFALDAMNKAIEARTSVAFHGVEAAEMYQAQVPQQDSPQYEGEEAYDTVESILQSTGFHHPERFFSFWGANEKYEHYRGWDVYFSVPNGGIVAIGLHNTIQSKSQAWDASTEIIQELDSTFPESLGDFDEIIAWTRELIDKVENLEAPGQLPLPLNFSDDDDRDVLIGAEYDRAVEEELALDDEDFTHILQQRISTPDTVAETTELQKLLEVKNDFVFGELHARVIISSVWAEPDDTTEERTEEAKFWVTNFTGDEREYYENARKLLFDYRSDITSIVELRQAAEDFAKAFNQDLKHNEKIAGWNADKIEQSNQSVDLIEKFSITHLSLPSQNMKVVVTPGIGQGKFAGATFSFYTWVGNNELFVSSQTADEIARAENNPEFIATALAEKWLKQQELKKIPPVGTTHTEEKKPKDDFTELVYLSDAVAYLKRKDNGQILTAYLGFSNKTPEGDRAPTMAKSRAVRWQDYLMGVYQLAVSGPRECQRIESKNPKQPFKYELKIIEPSMGQLQGLASENFGLYPGEVEKKGSEAKREIPPQEIELSDFEFEAVADFDSINPEYAVKYKGIELTNIWSSLRTIPGKQAERLWRHKLLKPGEEIELKDREAAALHALQRTRGLA